MSVEYHMKKMGNNLKRKMDVVKFMMYFVCEPRSRSYDAV